MVLGAALPFFPFFVVASLLFFALASVVVILLVIVASVAMVVLPLEVVVPLLVVIALLVWFVARVAPVATTLLTTRAYHPSTFRFPLFYRRCGDQRTVAKTPSAHTQVVVLSLEVVVGLPLSILSFRHVVRIAIFVTPCRGLDTALEFLTLHRGLHYHGSNDYGYLACLSAQLAVLLH